MDIAPLNEFELQNLYHWLDQLPLSRPKKNIARDFSDGGMVAEIVHHYIPKFVEIHNYPQAHSVQQKQYNWSTLNLKVFKKLGFQLSKNDIDAVINCQPDSIEKVLKFVQVKIEKYLEQQKEQERKQQELMKYQKEQQQLEQQIKASQPKTAQSNMSQILAEKDQSISELKETVEILSLKIKKLEQLVMIKDQKIQSLINQIQQQQQ